MKKINNKTKQGKAPGLCGQGGLHPWLLHSPFRVPGIWVRPTPGQGPLNWCSQKKAWSKGRWFLKENQHPKEGEVGVARYTRASVLMQELYSSDWKVGYLGYFQNVGDGGHLKAARHQRPPLLGPRVWHHSPGLCGCCLLRIIQAGSWPGHSSSSGCRLVACVGGGHVWCLGYHIRSRLTIELKSSLYILETSPSSDSRVATVSTPLPFSFFIFSALSFVEKFLILMKSRWSSFSFMVCVFSKLSTKSLHILRSYRLFLDVF